MIQIAEFKLRNGVFLKSLYITIQIGSYSTVWKTRLIDEKLQIYPYYDDAYGDIFYSKHMSYLNLY